MLFTVAEAATMTGADSGSSEFQRLCAAVDRLVKTYIGAEVEHGTRTEYLSGRGDAILWPRNRPVHTVTDVRIDSTGAFDADTAIDDVSKVAIRDGRKLVWTEGTFPLGSGNVRVTLTAGYNNAADHAPTAPDVPDDLKDACLRVVATLNARGAGELMQSEAVGGYSYTRFLDALDPFTRGILDHYRVMS